VVLVVAGFVIARARQEPDRPAQLPSPSFVVLSDFRFVPGSVGVEKGASVTMTLRNIAGRVHNLSLEGPAALRLDNDVGAMKSLGVAFVAPAEPGKYTFYCKYHRDRGMRGTLVVA
jgi:plastocyanin